MAWFDTHRQELPQEEPYGAQRTGITPEEFARQFQGRRENTSGAIDLIDLLMRYGIARTPDQARLVLVGIIALVLLAAAWQWRGTFSGPSSYPTQTQIDAALELPMPPPQ